MQILDETPKGALKIKDAAKYLGGISTTTVRRLIKRDCSDQTSLYAMCCFQSMSSTGFFSWGGVLEQEELHHLRRVFPSGKAIHLTRSASRSLTRGDIVPVYAGSRLGPQNSLISYPSAAKRDLSFGPSMGAICGSSKSRWSFGRRGDWSRDT